MKTQHLQLIFGMTTYHVLTIFVDILEGNTFYSPNHLDFINGNQKVNSG